MIRKTNFFEGCCWFKFSNLGLALGMTEVVKANNKKVFTLKTNISNHHNTVVINLAQLLWVEIVKFPEFN